MPCWMMVADAVIELIALGDDALEERRRQRFGIERQRRAMQVVEDQVDEREHEPAQLGFRRRRFGLHVGHQRQQLVERVLVAGEENLFLVLEVVVEVALRHFERRGDFVDARAVIAAPAEGRRRALQNLDSPIGRRWCRDIRGLTPRRDKPGVEGSDTLYHEFERAFKSVVNFARGTDCRSAVRQLSKPIPRSTSTGS